MIAVRAARSPSEREVKLAAPPSFRMPRLDGLADGVQLVPREPQQLSTTYFDTEDLRLARWGVNVRHRLGEGWTVKLSAQSDGALLVRPELVFAGNSRRPPAPAVDLVRAFVRSAQLRPQARLRTVRRGIELHDAKGRLLAEVLEDEVTVLRVFWELWPLQRFVGLWREAGIEDVQAQMLSLGGAVVVWGRRGDRAPRRGAPASSAGPGSFWAS
jgi:CYTH domain